MQSNNEKTNLFDILKTKLSEMAFELLTDSINQDIKNIKSVFKYYPDETSSIFKYILILDQPKFNMFLPVLEGFKQYAPSVEIMIESCKRLHALTSCDIEQIIKIYTLHKITTLPKDTGEYKLLFDEISQYTKNLVSQNINHEKKTFSESNLDKNNTQTQR